MVSRGGEGPLFLPAHHIVKKQGRPALRGIARHERTSLSLGMRLNEIAGIRGAFGSGLTVVITEHFARPIPRMIDYRYDVKRDLSAQIRRGVWIVSVVTRYGRRVWIRDI